MSSIWSGVTRRAAAVRDQVARASLPSMLSFLGKSMDDVELGESAHSTMGGASSGNEADGFDERRRHMWDGVTEGPWGFLTSRYSIALLIMAVVVNRIQHICTPRGRPTSLRRRTLLLLRLPSLAMLTRAVFCLALITVHLSFESNGLAWRSLNMVVPANWSRAVLTGWTSNGVPDPEARDRAVMWMSFLATSIGVATEALVRSLEANHDEPPAFNLVGFAFLLHFHANSRTFPPSKHVYFCVLLQVAEIWALALAGCRRRARVQRLPITAFFGICSTIHYIVTTRSGAYPFLQAFNRAPEVALICVILMTIALHALTMVITEGKIDPSRLLFNRSNLPAMTEDYSLALFKLGTACLESTRLSGLSRELAPLNTFSGSWVELGQSGNASVGHQRTPSDPWSRAPPTGFANEIRELRISRSDPDPGGATITGASRWRAALRFLRQLWMIVKVLGDMLMSKARRWLPTPPRTIRNLPRYVRLFWHGTTGEERRERRMAERRRAEEASLQRQRDEERRWRERQDRTAAARPHAQGETGTEGTSAAVSMSGRCPGWRRAASPSSSMLDHFLWQRFLAPDVPLVAEEDEEDDEWEGEDSGSESEDGEADEPDVRETVRRVWGGQEEDASGLRGRALSPSLDEQEADSLLDLGTLDFDAAPSTPGALQLHASSASAPSTPFNHLLLAHLSRAEASPPLTRRAYRSLLNASLLNAEPRSTARSALAGMDEDERQLRDVLRRRRRGTSNTGDEQHDWERERQRLCVVCCTEDRTVVCWPCRCLALCDECRENLASRPASGKHSCPCCRTEVEGFSRLFVP